MALMLEILLSNLLVALLLAIPAALTGAWGRQPAITHALWLLVLVKLITPPIFLVPIPWPALSTVEAPVPEVGEPVRLAEVHEEPVPVPAPMPFDEAIPDPAIAEEIAPEIVLPQPAPEPVMPPAPPVPDAPALEPVSRPMPWLETMAGFWGAGSIAWLAVCLARLRRFQRMLRFATPAAPETLALAQQFADRLGVRCPEVALIPGRLSPMLWTFGTTRLLLPAELITRLSADQLASLIAHELAHWRRRDDRVRWLELAVLTLYWWCPLVWWARRELRQAEEECCDAWVVSLLPESSKDYALALLETVDFLSGVPAPLPMAASGVGHVRLLKRRLTMILQAKTPRALSRVGVLCLAGVGLLALPMVPGWTQAPSDRPAQSGDKKFRKDVEPNDRADLERLRDELQKRQKDLQKQSEQLQQLMQQLQKLEKAGAPQPGGGGVPGKKPGGGAGNFPAFPGNPPFGPGNPIDQRLNEMERKLEQLLQEVRGLRNDMKAGPKRVPGFTPNPGQNPNPAPRSDNRPDANTSRPAAPVGPRAVVPPQPPVAPVTPRTPQVPPNPQDQGAPRP